MAAAYIQLGLFKNTACGRVDFLVIKVIKDQER
jgi:hypothetical protein